MKMKDEVNKIGVSWPVDGGRDRHFEILSLLMSKSRTAIRSGDVCFDKACERVDKRRDMPEEISQLRGGVGQILIKGHSFIYCSKRTCY